MGLSGTGVCFWEGRRIPGNLSSDRSTGRMEEEEEEEFRALRDFRISPRLLQRLPIGFDSI